jgi:hypothetical protein
VALVDLTGKKFNRWTVESLCEDSGKVKFWNCVCECGTRKRVFGGDLKRGGSKSCGCLMRETSAGRLRSHDMSRHRAYRNWIHAKGRCENPANEFYSSYGGRGIKVCERWSSFEAFWEDMGPTWKEGLTLDRIDNHKGYEPDNCRWATAMQQANNRWNNRIINTPNGPMTISQAARLFGIKRITLGQRVDANWPDDRLFDPPRFSMRWHNPKKE